MTMDAPTATLMSWLTLVGCCEPQRSRDEQVKLAKKTADVVERSIYRCEHFDAATFLPRSALVLGLRGVAGTRVELEWLTFAGV